MGYSFIWGSKWIIGSLISGTDVISDAVNQIHYRTTGGTWKGMELTVSNIIGYAFDTLKVYHLQIPMIVIAVIAIAVIAISAYLLCMKDNKVFWENSWLLLIACMPLVWFFVLREHSVQHRWFT